MRLVYLTMENFMAYAKQRVDFGENGCYVITGENLDKGGKSNGSGKSSIFWAITMAIYNQARGKTLGESVKIGAKTCTLELVLSSGNKFYKIQRKRKREGTSTTFLWVADNVEFKNAKDITGNDQTETQVKINAIMKMDYQSFCHSMYFKEDASSIFAQSTRSVRFNIIKNSLQVDRYDRYAKEAKKDLESVMSELSTLSSHISSGEDLKAELDENIKQFDSTSVRINKLKGMLSNIDHRISAIQSERSGCEIKLSEIKSVEAQRAEIINVISEVDKHINSVKSQMKKCNDEIAEYRRTLGLIKSEMETLKSEKNGIPVLSEEEEESLKESINSLNTQMSLNSTKIQEMNEKIKALRSATGSQCWACNKPLTSQEAENIIAEANSVISISEGANASIAEDINKMKSAIKKSRENAQRISKIDIQIDKLESKANTIVELGTKVKETLASLDYGQMEYNKKEYVDKAELMSRQINTLKAQVKNIIDRKDAIDSEERSLISQKNSVIGDISESNQKIGELKLRRKEIEDLLTDIEEKQSIVSKLWDRRTIIENFLAACSKKGGIPSILISQAIVEIEKFANETLSQFDSYDGMQIKMEMDKPDEIEISVRMGSEVEFRDFDTFSGGERFIISFAIRMALAQVLSKKYGADIKFILLDEAGTALDEYNTTRFADMVKRLSRDSLILLITHQNNLRDFIQQNMLVRRHGGKSTIITNAPGSMNNLA